MIVVPGRQRGTSSPSDEAREGAALWAERARIELPRVGLRRSAPAGPTSSEQRVAELAAVSRTNREVAAQLFMSPKTVEANLARIYRKLGVRSRAGLGAQLATARFIGPRPRKRRETPDSFRPPAGQAIAMSGGDGARGYLVECYWPGVTEQAVADAARRAVQAAVSSKAKR